MAKTVYLICGVSGSGKTWVCRQLEDKYDYIPHDEHYHNQAEVVAERITEDRPVITESPFGERILREQLELKHGLKVVPFFVITAPDVVAVQYYKREGKPLPKSAYTRASTILKRALEWNAFHGSSAEVLKHLKDL